MRSLPAAAKASAGRCRSASRRKAARSPSSISSPEAGEETAQLAGADATIRTYAVDVGDYDAVAAAVAQVEADLGPIGVLVNNAGWDQPMPFLKTDRPLWDKIIRINLHGPLNTHHVVAGKMAAAGAAGGSSTSPPMPRA